MKKEGHPDYHFITVTLTDGTSFKTRSTYGEDGATLALDWFLLPVFPLFYRWPMGAVWTLVIGATLLVVGADLAAGAHLDQLLQAWQAKAFG